MKFIFLKIDDELLGETEGIRTRLGKSLSRYVNEALKHYNQTQHRQLLKGKLARESKLVREDSMQVLREFEGMNCRAVGMRYR